MFSHCRDRRPRLFDYGFKQKQNNQPRHCNQPSLKVFCLLFYKKVRSLLYIRRKSRKTNLDIAINPAQKFFAYFFTKKYGACFIYEEKAERLTSTLQSTQVKSFLPTFLQKSTVPAFLQKRRSVSPLHKQKDQP